MVEAAPRLAAAAATLDLVCQTGTRDFDMVRAAFERHGVQGRVERFIDAMDREMKAAGLVVSRAGATTLAEMTAAGRPAILIPLPTATDDHQRQNARGAGERRRGRVDGAGRYDAASGWPSASSRSAAIASGARRMSAAPDGSPGRARRKTSWTR